MRCLASGSLFLLGTVSVIGGGRGRAEMDYVGGIHEFKLKLYESCSRTSSYPLFRKRVELINEG